MEDEVFYPVDEVAEILKPTTGRIRQMLREGSPEGLPPEESGGHGRITMEKPRRLGTRASAKACRGFSLFSRATRMASKGFRSP